MENISGGRVLYVWENILISYIIDTKDLVTGFVAALVDLRILKYN